MPLSLLKSYGFYFRVGERQYRKNAKITPVRKFPHLQYSQIASLFRRLWELSVETQQLKQNKT